MADFSIETTQLAAPQGAGTAPIAPVQQQAMGIDLSGIKGLADIFSENMKEKRKAEAENLKQSVVGAYAKEQQLINDGVASGEINPRTASVKSKSLLGTYLANYSQYTKELNDLRAAFEGGTELGDIASAAKEEARIQAARVSTAMENGAIIRPWQTPEEREPEIQKALRSKTARDNFKVQADINDERRAQGAYDNDTADREGKKQAWQLMSDVTSIHMDASASFIRNLSARVKGGMPQEEARLELNNYFAGVNQTILAASKGFPEDSSYFKSLFENARVVAEKAIDPKAKAEDVKGSVDLMIAQAQALALQDREARAYAASSQLFPNNPVATLALSSIQKSIIAKMTANDEDTVGGTGAPAKVRVAPFVGDPAAEKDIVKYLSNNIKLLDTNTFPDKEKASTEIANIINKTLRQTAKEFAGATGSDAAKRFITLSKFYASPEFGKFAASGKLNNAAQQAVVTAWSSAYVPVVRGSVQVELSKPLVGTSSRPTADNPNETLTIASVVDVSFSGASVQFTPKSNDKLSPFEREDRRRSLEVLKSSQEALTQLVRTGAHLEGHMKYAEYWEKNKYIFVPQIYPAPPGVIVNGYRSKGLAGNGPDNWEKVK